MIKKIFSLLAVLTIFISAYAQSVSYIGYSHDARSMALGGSGVATSADAYSFFNNTSAIALSDSRGAIAALYTKWMPNSANLTMIGGSGFFKLGSNISVAFAGRHIGYEEVPTSDDNGLSTGTFQPTDFIAGLGVAYKITGNISASVNVNMITSKIDDNASAKAFSGDLGFTYSADKFNIGLKVANLGSKLDYGNGPYSLPAHLNAGFAYKTEINEKSNLTALLNAGYLISSSGLMAGIGVEYSYNKLLNVRLGGHYGDEAKSIPSYISAGLGICLKGITIDVSYLISSNESPINKTLSLGLGYSF